jgi:hypothetical protein
VFDFSQTTGAAGVRYQAAGKNAHKQIPTSREHAVRALSVTLEIVLHGVVSSGGDA